MIQNIGIFILLILWYWNIFKQRGILKNLKLISLCLFISLFPILLAWGAYIVSKFKSDDKKKEWNNIGDQILYYYFILLLIITIIAIIIWGISHKIFRHGRLGGNLNKL
tara:strand:- start:158 stop:484 length:327 start_codon:yes stop_codon:yes gene_type:complete